MAKVNLDVGHVKSDELANELHMLTAGLDVTFDETNGTEIEFTGPVTHLAVVIDRYVALAPASETSDGAALGELLGKLDVYL